MTDDSSTPDPQADARQDRRWVLWYVAILAIGFSLLYLPTRSSVLIGDGKAFITLAKDGRPADLHYGEPSHFLQVPLSRGIWKALHGIGLTIPLDDVFVAISFVGMVVAALCVGLIATELLGSRPAAWIAALLFGTSLNAWTQWNGELYGLGLGFVSAALLCTLRRRWLMASVLWTLALLARAEFALAAPAFILAVWIAEPMAPTRSKIRTAVIGCAMVAAAFVLVLLLGAWMLGKWTDTASLAQWLERSYATRQADISGPEIPRAIKGLVTAYTVAGHFWRDILTGRGVRSVAFVVASGVGLVVLAITGLLAVAAGFRRRLALFAMVWLLPSHVLINWWFIPTVEKYHAAALPGFVLLITGGLVHAAARIRPAGRTLLLAGYVVTCAGLNFFGAVLPMYALGRQTADAERTFATLEHERGGRAVFVACDSFRALGGGMEYLRLRSIWRGAVPDIQQNIVSWIQARLEEGKEPYLVGRWCFPEEWKTTWSKAPFDLFFLEGRFRLVATPLMSIPLVEPAPTDPFSWRRADVMRIEQARWP